MKQKYRLIIYHVIFWLAYMLVSTLVEFATNPKDYFFSIGDFFFTQFPSICTFYMCLFVYTKYASPLKIYSLIAGIIFAYLFSYLNWYITAYYIRPLIKANGGPTTPFHIWIFAVGVLWLYIKYSFFAFAYYYATENVKHQKQLRLNEEEKHHAQYTFLRAQINPHFLNNTLNFFYAKSLPLSSELSDGIMTLSQIMHYSLKQDDDDQTVLIDEEIEHIKNVIKINQLRFKHELMIDFEVLGNTGKVSIIPFVLITIVENILKHGDCTDESNHAKILLEIGEDNSISLRTYNKKKESSTELSSGIGMENIKKRLNYYYGSKFNLSIDETETEYSISLIIN
ncbi:sensor histidine kinase [Pedobacter fastidiosus]|uniref:Histidine kinase n=1 Tax=Pedobacter fastidiosus TaxID=2765361 RepID=A0ABR7KP86_9SPHI|nr:histidine kinase [Pedobacter fastidiosus]MBC6109552.1 histidine kinase [Pedobacter fastidiosus]